MAVALHAVLTVRALARRRLTMVVLVALPIVFSQAVGDSAGRSVRALVFGVSWAVATAAYFAAIAAREVEPRLRLAGWTAPALLAGRLSGLGVLAAALGGLFWALVLAEHGVAAGPLAADLAVTAATAIAVGSAVGAVLRREMDGVLVLFLLAGMQAVVNPFDDVARLLPFWSSRELATYAVDGPAAGSLRDGLAHAAVVIVVCALAAWLGRARVTGRVAARWRTQPATR